ncbi:MAG: crossover junction endodeoxyribonuclease RuvC [Acidimicrobiia bacterium]|jgi:crossover junction endodeoxyribonuclease RuvC|nr:crossover junction endodeoxyribonuclease RuvC [Acidimicrobiia bacterium]
MFAGSSTGLVLGIDPGLSRCGFAVLNPGRQPSVLEYGVVTTSPQDDLAVRLGQLHREVEELIGRHGVVSMAIERVFFSSNVSTGISVANAAGVVMALAAIKGIPVVEYTATYVKRSVCGDGSADKTQVQFMVKTLCRLQETPSPPDAADAIAIALCHGQAVMSSSTLPPGQGWKPGGQGKRGVAAGLQSAIDVALAKQSGATQRATLRSDNSRTMGSGPALSGAAPKPRTS